MADEVPDEIAALPGSLGEVTLVGPGIALYKFDGTAKIAAGMPEGKTFAGKDETASKHLATFVQNTSTGFDAYSNTARNAGHDYLASDDTAAGGLRSVGTITHQAV
jgi:hypothetical protein